MRANVWAACFDTPQSQICIDARLGEHEPRRTFLGQRTGPEIVYSDRVWGQAGWDIGVRFRSLPELTRQLSSLRFPTTRFAAAHPVLRGEIAQLAINAHGEPGTSFVSGERHRPDSLRLETLERYESELRTIREMTSEGALIYFMGCELAAGHGAELLARLSGGVWSGRYVIGFRHRGYAHAGGMTRPRGLEHAEGYGYCSEPGMRDGDSIGSSGQRRDGSHPNWSRLDLLPWATYRSRSAVMAYRGAIIGAPGARPSSPGAP